MRLWIRQVLCKKEKKHFFGIDKRKKMCIILYCRSAHGVPPEGYAIVAELADAHV